MKQFFGDKIFILGLEKNDTKEWRKYYQEHLPNEKIQFWIEKGTSYTKNDGELKTNLGSILNFNICNPVSENIFQNHVKILRHMREKKYSSIMVLEDDATFPKWCEKKWNRVQSWLMNHKQWDICYLGYCQWPKMISTFVSSDIVKLSTPLTTHAYIISNSGMQKFLNYYESHPNLEKTIHIDKALHQTPKMQKYGVFPMISFQKTCPALYVKACDQMNVRVYFSTCCKVNEIISVLLPFLFILILVLISYSVLTRII